MGTQPRVSHSGHPTQGCIWVSPIPNPSPAGVRHGRGGLSQHARAPRAPPPLGEASDSRGARAAPNPPHRPLPREVPRYFFNILRPFSTTILIFHSSFPALFRRFTLLLHSFATFYAPFPEILKPEARNVQVAAAGSRLRLRSLPRLLLRRGSAGHLIAVGRVLHVTERGCTTSCILYTSVVHAPPGTKWLLVVSFAY